MVSTEPGQAYYGLFDDTFRTHIHQLIAWGYQDARQHIQSTNEQEPAITGYIVEAIVHRLRALDAPDWCVHYFIADDPPIPKKGCSGRSRPRADMIIEASFSGRPQAVCEAKRLHTRGYGVAKYIAPDGMGCFLDGTYASRYDEAIMLGYVQNNTLDHWKDKVMHAIDRHARALSLETPQQNTVVIHSLPLAWMSTHTRQSVGRSITLLHILLDCRPA